MLGSVIFSRWGHSVLTWSNRVSIHAWSVGVPDRPKREAMQHKARNLPGGACSHLGAVVRHCQQDRLFVALAAVVALADPLGLADLDGGPQALGVAGVGEHAIDLGGGLLDGDERGEPFTGDDVPDGVGDAASSGEVGDVIDPDLVALTDHPVGQGRCAPGPGGQNKPLGS